LGLVACTALAPLFFSWWARGASKEPIDYYAMGLSSLPDGDTARALVDPVHEMILDHDVAIGAVAAKWPNNTIYRAYLRYGAIPDGRRANSRRVAWTPASAASYKRGPSS